MKHILRSLLVALLMTYALPSNAQVHLGIRDNRFAWFGYRGSCYYFGIEQSFYSEKPSLQHARLLAGYHNGKEWLQYAFYGYVGAQWSFGYYDAGVGVDSKFFPRKRVSILAVIAPHFDSDLGWTFCSKAGATLKIVEGIKTIAYYSNIPEFRMPEHRVTIGMSFGGDKLSITPMISIPLKGDIRNVRILMSFSKSF